MGRGAFRAKRNARRRKRVIFPYGPRLIRQDLEPVLYKLFTAGFPSYAPFLEFGDANKSYLSGRVTKAGTWIIDPPTATGTGGEERRLD